MQLIDDSFSRTLVVEALSDTCYCGELVRLLDRGSCRIGNYR